MRSSPKGAHARQGSALSKSHFFPSVAIVVPGIFVVDAADRVAMTDGRNESARSAGLQYTLKREAESQTTSG